MVLLQLTRLAGGAPEQELDLGVERAELRPGPALQQIVQRRIEAEENRFPRGHRRVAPAQVYRVPVLSTGWVPRSPQSTTSRLETIAAFRSSSRWRVFFCASISSAFSTIPPAPSTNLYPAAMMALACWRCSIAWAISGA